MTLYPSLQEVTESDQRFRLDRIAALDGYLQQEIEARRNLSKKYLRTINIVHGISVGNGVVGLGLEVAGISLLTTGIGAPFGIALSGIGVCSFGIDLACGQINRKLSRKLDKHRAIEQTARTKLNTIHKLVSSALVDSKISDDEFKLISEEVEKYDQLKESIRSKAVAVNDDTVIKKALLRTEFEKYMQGFLPSAFS
jgi:hypothetical protein